MNWRARLAVALFPLLIGLIGCLAAEPTPETLPTLPPLTAPPLQSATPLIRVDYPTPAANASAPALSDTAAYVQGATSALANALNVPESSIIFLGITEQQWPDSSLGCPQPDQAYAQVVTPGYLIALKVDQATHEVHSDKNQHFVVCLNGNGSAASPTPPDPIVAEFMSQIKQSLAADLGIPPDDAVVVTSEAVDWPDGSLGCKPGRGTAYSPETISGYRIVFAVEDVYYEYHTSFDNWILCETPTQ